MTSNPYRENEEIEQMKLKIERLQLTLGTLLSWMAASANTPIRESEAKVLIEMMQKGWRSE